MPAATLVIVNPASRNGATRRRWRTLEPQLREVLRAFGDVEVELTRGPRDAERIGREAARAGVERLVVAGGDGTTSEVVSGLLAARLADEVEIGLLPLGTGGDLLRSVGVPRNLDAAVEALASGGRRRVDAGRLEYCDRQGEKRSAFFMNVASFGISGMVDDLVNRTPKTFGGTVSFAIGTLRAIARYRCEPVTIRVDGEVVHDGPLALGAAANGRCFGGGMQIAPDAAPDDGVLDIVVAGDLSKARLLSYFPSIYRGTHLSLPRVSHHRGTRITADAVPGKVWLDVDGEALGTLPASIELLPGAVRLFGVATGS